MILVIESVVLCLLFTGMVTYRTEVDVRVSTMDTSGSLVE